MALETYDRIRHLRKEVLKMPQDKFGTALGANRDMIANIEQNRLARPEQKEPLYRLICKTFNVSYEWLTTGQGDIFVETADTFLDGLCSQFDVGYYAHKLIECYLKLDKEKQNVIEGFFDNLVAACNSGVPADHVVDEAIIMMMPGDKHGSGAASPLTLEEQADKFAEMARQQFLAEKIRESPALSANESGAV